MNSQRTRRDVLKMPMAAGAAAALATESRLAAAAHMDEYDPDNTKIATMVNVRASSATSLH